MCPQDPRLCGRVLEPSAESPRCQETRWSTNNRIVRRNGRKTLSQIGNLVSPCANHLFRVTGGIAGIRVGVKPTPQKESGPASVVKTALLTWKSPGRSQSRAVVRTQVFSGNCTSAIHRLRLGTFFNFCGLALKPVRFPNPEFDLVRGFRMLLKERLRVLAALPDPLVAK